MSYLIKIVISVAIIIGASEIAKRIPSIGALIISMPILSMLAVSFLYYDTRDLQKVAEFTQAIPLLIIPSLIFYYGVGYLAQHQFPFILAMVISTGLMLLAYGGFMYVINKF